MNTPYVNAPLRWALVRRRRRYRGGLERRASIAGKAAKERESGSGGVQNSRIIPLSFSPLVSCQSWHAPTLSEGRPPRRAPNSLRPKSLSADYEGRPEVLSISRSGIHATSAARRAPPAPRPQSWGDLIREKGGDGFVRPSVVSLKLGNSISLRR